MATGVIRVEYTATLADAVGVATEEYDASGVDSVADLLAAVRTRHGDRLDDRLFNAEGRLARSVIVAVNDQQVAEPSAANLAANDHVLLLSAIGGG